MPKKQPDDSGDDDATGAAPPVPPKRPSGASQPGAHPATANSTTDRAAVKSSGLALASASDNTGVTTPSPSEEASSSAAKNKPEEAPAPSAAAEKKGSAAAAAASLAMAPAQEQPRPEPNLQPPTTRTQTLAEAGDAVALDAQIVDEEDIEKQLESRIEEEKKAIAEQVRNNLMGNSVVANVVPDGKEDDSGEDEEEARRKKQKRTMWIGIASLLLIILAITIPVAVTRSSNGSEEDKTKGLEDSPTSGPGVEEEPTAVVTSEPTPSPSTLPTFPETEDPALTVLLNKLEPVMSREEYEDKSSDEYRAFQWLFYEDEYPYDFFLTDGWVLQERFVAALFYFATQGDEWFSDNNFLSNSTVCEWQNARGDNGIFCYSDFYIMQIRLGMFVMNSVCLFLR